jgi:hypothetical protein
MGFRDNWGFAAFWQFLASGYAAMLALIPGIFIFVGRNLGKASRSEAGLLEAIASQLSEPSAWVLLACGFSFAVLFFLAGMQLFHQRPTRFLWFAALSELLFFPVGTVAGILLLQVLSRLPNNQS